MEIPLYHGTDSRILAMSSDERKFFKQDCLLAIDYMWPFFEPYYPSIFAPSLNLPFDVDDEEETELRDLIYIINSLKNDNKLFQYDYFYLTNSLERAIDYAKNAFAFGEVGFLAYSLLNVTPKFQFKDWNPDQMTTQALARIKKFGEAKPSPVILVFTNYILENLRDEKGKPIIDIFLPTPENHFAFECSYRYLGELDVSSAVQLNLQEALQKLKDIEKSRLCY